PYYLEYTRLGGPKRDQALNPDDLTLRDLEEVMQDVRRNAGSIYEGVYDEYRAVLDQNRDLIAWHKYDAREQLKSKQEALIRELEGKLQAAADEASDEFMYQDRAEVEKELEAAR